jgi:glycosyltransferase involved in cell wall biosynthesis
LRILALDLGAGWRGGQKQTALVAATLATRGHDVTLLAAEGSPLASEAASMGRVGLSPVPGRGEASPRLLAAVARAARRLHPDVLWASDGRGHGAAVWSLAAARTPLVVHRRVVFRPGRDPLSRLKYRAARRFVAISGDVARVLSESGVPPDRIAVVPDGLPESAFVNSPVPSAPPFRLVHAGAFDGLKGQDVAVVALARLVEGGIDATLTLLGDGLKRAATERLAEDSGVRSRCAFAGDVPDVPAHLAASHLLLLPSKSEGASLVLVEAMAAGCAALSHDLPATREVCGGGTAGRLVPTLEPGAWAEAVESLLRDEKERLRLVTEGRATAATRTLAESVERLEAVFESVLEAA